MVIKDTIADELKKVLGNFRGAAKLGFSAGCLEFVGDATFKGVTKAPPAGEISVTLIGQKGGKEVGKLTQKADPRNVKTLIFQLAAWAAALETRSSTAASSSS
jgi:hypothetical protein